jgi:hypothetical protein
MIHRRHRPLVTVPARHEERPHAELAHSAERHRLDRLVEAGGHRPTQLSALKKSLSLRNLRKIEFALQSEGSLAVGHPRPRSGLYWRSPGFQLHRGPLCGRPPSRRSVEQRFASGRRRLSADDVPDLPSKLIDALIFSKLWLWHSRCPEAVDRFPPSRHRCDLDLQ